MTYLERLKFLKAILTNHKLDIILAYSTRYDTALAKALTGTTCKSPGNYFFCTKDDQGFFEVEHQVLDLKERSKMKVIAVSDESVYGNFLNEISHEWKRVGVLGPAPFTHFLNLKAEVVDLSETVLPILRTKNSLEIKQLADTFKTLKSTLETTSGWIQPGMSELELAKTLRHRLLETVDSLSADLAVCSGGKTPQSPTSNRLLVSGDYLWIEAGVIRDGLFANCTRTFRVSEPLPEEFTRFQLAHQNVIRTIKEGLPCADLENLYKQELKRNDLPAETLAVADLGHFIGFTHQEHPYFITFESNHHHFDTDNVFCLKPQIIVAGMALKIEDMVTIRNGRGLSLAEL